MSSTLPLQAVGRVPLAMRRVSFAAATVAVLWKRELKRFVRQPSRLAGALGQPLVFWLVLGSGFAGSFRIPGSPVGYLEYFFPGVMAMVLLFAGVFGAMSLIEDRREGFLQAVLAGPGGRGPTALGKILGGATVALLQAMAFAALAPLAGFAMGKIAWIPLVTTLGLAAVGLSALGFALAWKVDSTAGFHAVVGLLLIPLWVVSGAMFPASGPVLPTLVRLNPLAYAVEGIRGALGGAVAPLDLVVVALFAAGSVGLALVASRR